MQAINYKGGRFILAIGYLISQVYTSNSTIPINDASIAITRKDGDSEDLLAFRTTDSSGRTSSIPLFAPDRSLSETPGHENPFSVYNVRVSHPLYYTVLIENVQIFADNTSLQNVKLVPLREEAELDYKPTIFNIESQNL